MKVPRTADGLSIRGVESDENLFLSIRDSARIAHGFIAEGLVGDLINAIVVAVADVDEASAIEDIEFSL